jgi:hypothetical protein
MDQNLEWATAVGDVFLDQPADVMNSIAAGNLTDTPQQHIVKEGSCVRIVPAQPEAIYVPQYDPDVVYEEPYSRDAGPLLTFGVGYAVGSWLNYDCDSDRRSIYVGQWPIVAPDFQGGQGTPPPHGNGQGNAPRNLSKHAQGSNHSDGGVNNQAKEAPSTTGASTRKHQKHVDHSQSSAPQSNNSSRPPNGRKHQQKYDSQSAHVAKQNKP